MSRSAVNFSISRSSLSVSTTVIVLSLTLVLSALARCAKRRVFIEVIGRWQAAEAIRWQCEPGMMAAVTCAKRRVFIDSSMFCASMRSATMMVDFELPPSESCSSRVSFESRYGTCVSVVREVRRAQMWIRKGGSRQHSDGTQVRTQVRLRPRSDGVQVATDVRAAAGRETLDDRAKRV